MAILLIIIYIMYQLASQAIDVPRTDYQLQHMKLKIFTDPSIRDDLFFVR